MKPEVAISLYKLDNLSSESIVDLANEWLKEGIFTESLSEIIFEKKPSMSTVGPLFESALKEIGIDIPTKIEAAKVALKDTIQRMVSGETDLMEGANFIYLKIYLKIIDELPDGEYVGTNLRLEHIFCWLREIWDCRDGSMILYYSDLPRDQAEIKFLAHLKEESEKWLTLKI